MINLGTNNDFVAIIMGDSHVTGQNPISRKDFYPDTIIRKFEEVISLAGNLQADMILSVGDIFHTPDPSNTTKGKLGAVLQTKPCPFYTLAGNHDLFGGNFSTYERTGVGLLQKLNALSILHDDKPLFFKKGKLRVQLTGQNYHFNIDHRNPEMDYCRRKAEGMTHSIHMAHGYLTDKKLIFPHTMIDRIRENTDADVTLTGHLHNPFRKEYDGKIFANPGGLGRMTSSTGDMRMPKVFILRITQEGVLTLEDYFLKTALAAEEVLDRSHLQTDETHYYKMAAFMDSLSELNQKSNQSLDIYEILHQVTEDKNIDPAVKEDALLAISLAEAELQGAGTEEYDEDEDADDEGSEAV